MASRKERLKRQRLRRELRGQRHVAAATPEAAPPVVATAAYASEPPAQDSRTEPQPRPRFNWNPILECVGTAALFTSPVAVLLIGAVWLVNVWADFWSVREASIAGLATAGLGYAILVSFTVRDNAHDMWSQLGGMTLLFGSAIVGIALGLVFLWWIGLVVGVVMLAAGIYWLYRTG